MPLPEGWSGAELLALLTQLRNHMTLYIYSTDETFALTVQRHLRCDKNMQAIKEATRELLNGLAFAMKTRKFTNDAILVDDAYVHPYEHLYETMAAQRENRQGGVWDPDELRTGTHKMETCRHFFDENPERFFTRATIWSKTVPDVRTKFYLWREIYLEELVEEAERTEGDLKRLECLSKIFEGVPPAPSPLPPTPSPVASTAGSSKVSPAPTGVRITASTGKPAKSRIWTPEDLDAFVQLLVDITLELQTKGVSSTVSEIGVRLNRTEPSLIGKVQDIRARYENRTRYHRAAEIPSNIYDETSVAHKIFTADWSDRDDPYSLAIFALKEQHNRTLARLKIKNRNARPPPLQMEMRQRTSAMTSPSGSVRSLTTPKTTETVPHSKQIHPITKITTDSRNHLKPPRVPTSSNPNSPLTPSYSEFVRECAAMIKWDEPRTYKLCMAIKTALPVYTSSPRRVFYEEVAGAVGNVADTQLVYFRGERILRLCERRYGSLDCFAAAVEGNGESIDVVPRLTAESSLTEEEKSLRQSDPQESDGEDQLTAVESPQDRVASPVSPSPRPSTSPSLTTPNPEPPVNSLASSQPPKPAPQVLTPSFGKSSHTAKQILQQKGGSTRTVSSSIDHTESSPSVHRSTPDHDGLDDDGGETGDIETTSQRDQLDGDRNEDLESHNNRADIDRDIDRDDDDDDATQSLASSDFASDVSSDYGHDDHAPSRSQSHLQSHHRYQHHHHHHTSGPGRVQVSSRKTLVVEHAPHLCYCHDCGRRAHQNDHHHESVRGSAMTSVHRKRGRSEFYSESGRWVEDHHMAVHEIARRHFQSGRYESPDQDAAFRPDPDEIMSEREVTEMDSMWRTLMAPVETGIAELEATRREQQERAKDREKQEREANWKKELRQQVWDEWRAADATTRATTNGPRF